MQKSKDHKGYGGKTTQFRADLEMQQAMKFRLKDFDSIQQYLYGLVYADLEKHLYERHGIKWPLDRDDAQELFYLEQDVTHNKY